MKRSLTTYAIVVASSTCSSNIKVAHAFTPEPSASGKGEKVRSPKAASAHIRSSRNGRLPLPSVARSTKSVTDKRSIASQKKSNRIDIHKAGEESFTLRLKRQELLDDLESSYRVEDCLHEERQHDRRVFLSAMLAGTASGFSSVLAPEAASAYDQAYPVDLDFQGGDLATVRGERIAAQRAAAKKSRDDLTSNPLIMREPKDFLGSAVWAVALWFLSGSRSNPLVTPVANVLYDEKETPWLKDRNEGLFSPLPPGFLLLMGLVFLALGVVADRSILLLADGDKDICLQLAGVSLISGASLELGRIASGEKDVTREEGERDLLLQQEFAEFAEKRLAPGGNVHRSEITSAFRRFNAKYRVENDEYPLSDLEIERLARAWNRMQGNDDMSSAGFFNGISINRQADAFR